MSKKELQLFLITDFNSKPLGQYLALHGESDGVVVHDAPYGQVYQSLSSCEDKPLGIGIVWTLPERVIPSFSRAFQYEEVNHEACIDETRDFARAVLKYAEQRNQVFIASWTLPPGFRGYGLLDWKPGIGLAHLVASMNRILAEELSLARNIHMLDATRWLNGVLRPTSPKLWYATKVPFGNAVFEKAARDCISGIRAISGQSRKLVVVDLDNTLWGGVIGETGWQGVRLGGHDHVGEAFQDFQSSLVALANRGIQIAVVSKNDEKVALEALDNHPEMRIRRANLAGWRINWQDKAANIVSLADELNLGLSAIVFIDDNPAERDRVASALPEVLVPDWPVDPTDYVTALRSLDCFDVGAVTTEDRNRTAMYVAERERRDIKLVTHSEEDWLSHLETCLKINAVNSVNITRVAQLFNKTNQLNLSTRRMTENEILDWADKKNHSLLAVSASDKFGDMGLVGVISVEVENENGLVIDFILSCRVMGRKVEDAMLHVAADEILKMGGKSMQAIYQPTPRNRPTLDVFRASKLREFENEKFITNELSHVIKPKHIGIINAHISGEND